VWTDDLRVSNDVSAATWIAASLGGKFGVVARTVPRGYPAYVRICHPAADNDGRPVGWSEVAGSTGRQAHPLMQWHALVGSQDSLNMTDSLWRGSNPQRGNLEPEVLGPLCDLLSGHTADPEHCFFCLWDGYGWIGREPTPLRSHPAGLVRGREEPIQPAFSAEQLSRRRVELPHRSYLLLVGALPAALQIGWGPLRQSPNLFWPADHAWCAATELDFDSTLLGGTTELIETILATPTLDAWPVQPDDSLAFDADRINQVS
jgi:hypothetical protein